MIQVVKTKEMRSSTKVEGMLVQMSNKQWYAITRMMPPKNSWYLRCSPSTSTGKLSFGDEIFMYPTKTKADFEEGIKELTDILNNVKEGKIVMPNYY